MNVKQVIAQLQTLEGHRILVIDHHTDTVLSLDCITIEHLPPDQRQTADQGNIILHNSILDLDDTPEGLTFWARDIENITWIYDTNVTATIHTIHDHNISIIRLGPLETTK